MYTSSDSSNGESDFNSYYSSEEEEEEETPTPPHRSNKRKTPTPTPNLDSSPKEVRNWLELPPEIINLIFLKVGAFDILLGAQFVCSAWQKLSKQPHLYRSIHLRDRHNVYDKYKYSRRYDPERMINFAVHRSAGQLVEFSAKRIGTIGMLRSITSECSPLKCLRLVECKDIDDRALIVMAKKLPLLEELEILHGDCCKFTIRAFGHYCPQLKSFRLTCTPERLCEKSNGQAFSIARTMPGLHHLDLFGNPLSDTGLIAILDRCLHLKSLDCRRCFRLSFGEDLFKRCTDRNIDVKLPDDCCVGCGFDTNDCTVACEFDTSKCDAGFDFDEYYRTPVTTTKKSNGRRSPLKILRLVVCQQVTDPQLIAMAKKLPLLEELEMLHCFYTFKGVIRSFGRNCPQLKSFLLTALQAIRRHYLLHDTCLDFTTLIFGCPHLKSQWMSCIILNLNGCRALSIARHMRAILNGCPHLKSLDLRQFFNLKFAGDLKKRCADRNITLKLPNDSTVGYEFDTTCDGTFGPYDRDYEPDNYFWFDDLD